jgi:hypothetical protein
MYKKLIHPERLRKTPVNFSWIDHRLVRQGYLKQLNSDSIALYLFLVSVGDSQGLSYYSEIGISKLLTLKSVSCCRRELEQSNLIAYDNGIYQVLELSQVTTFKGKNSRAVLRATPKRQKVLSEGSAQPANVEIPECLKKLLEDLS